MWYSMLMRFSDAHDVHPTLMTFLYANARGLRERTETRGRSGKDGVDLERQKKTELAMAERLTKLTTNTQSKRLKVTPLTPPYAHVVLPYSYDSPMLMTFSHAHDVLLCEREGIARVY